MKTQFIQAASFLLLSIATATSAVHYVNVNGASPASPYTSWATAATSIQNAIDAAADGDQILVTNGVYQAGGRVVFGSHTNRVVVDKAVTVESVNGPAVTEIRGNPIKGNRAVRCVYLTTNATLIGFTLNQGTTREAGDLFQERSGGAVWCASVSSVVSNCFIANCVADQIGGAVFGGTLNSCTLSNNASSSISFPWTTIGGGAFNSTMNDCLVITNMAAGGGGVSHCTLNNCSLIGNGASSGGAAEVSSLSHCTIAGNSAQGGAGVYVSTLLDCTLTGNVGQYGAGAAYSTLTNCILANNVTYDNESDGLGGGAIGSTLYNCLIYGNVSSTSPAATQSTLYNCTVASNITTHVGGAIDQCLVYNSIVYDNESPDSPNFSSSMFSYCCTTPLPDDGDGNIADAPIYMDPTAHDFRQQTGSPCLNKGLNGYAPGFNDLDNNMRIAGGRVDLGAYELQPPIHYVDLNNADPVSPYTSWETAATNIQDAVDAAAAGDEVLVTNGVYRTGGKLAYSMLTNRVAVDKMLALRSVNGAAVTMIEGNPEMTENAVRCIYLETDTLLLGFTLTNGATRPNNDEPLEGRSGGGLWGNSYSAVVQDCVLVSNTAAAFGGGAYGGALNGCTLIGNSAFRGGGAQYSLLNNCTLSDNSGIGGGSAGGGAHDSVLTGCVLSGNTSDYGGGAGYSSLTDCILTNNSASEGGGAGSCFLTNCTLAANLSSYGGGAHNSILVICMLSDNVADQEGGGAFGGELQQCLLVSNSAPIIGGGAESATLTGCTLTGNSSSFGGGVGDSILGGCVLSGNFTFTDGPEGNSGGGAIFTRMTNCLLTGNSSLTGGGADSSRLYNCTVSGNAADTGGGVNNCNMFNSIVYHNSAAVDANHSDSSFEYSCTTPLPAEGTGNFADEPVFVDLDNGDFHLLDNSPCINAANNHYIEHANDLDGNARILSTMVDAGAYEFQSPLSSISYVWLMQHGLAIDGSADGEDTDGDGTDNFHEWFANTDPTDAGSVFKLLTISKDESGAELFWTSDPDRVYSVERSSALGEMTDFQVITSGIGGRSGTNTTRHFDPNTTDEGQLFYRVGVEFGPPPPPPDS